MTTAVNRWVYRSLAAGFASSALAMASVAQAQVQSPESTAKTEASASESAEPTETSDIVVTARRREESAQDVPVSLIVATGEMLRERSVLQFSDIQQQTPSLHVIPSFFGNTSALISSRGLSINDIRLNLDPVVGIYQDGVYLPRSVGVNASELIDIQRVEVLAGPQGTLFGKNTSGGAVSIFTQTPTSDLEGFMRVRVGSFGEAAITAVLNVPLSSTFAVRAVGSITDSDGWGTNSFDGSSTGEFDSRYFRGTALWTPNDRLTVTLRGDFTKAESSQAVYKGFQLLAPPTPGVGLGGPLVTVETALEMNNIPNLGAFLSLPTATRTTLIASADALLRTFALGDPSDGSIDESAHEDMTVWGASFQVNYEISDSISLNSLSAVRYFKRQGTSDLDGTPFTIIQYPFLLAKETQYSSELQLSGSFLDDRLTSVAGLYYAEESGNETSHQTTLGVLGGATATTFQNAEIATQSLGIFTQHTFAVTDNLNVTGGVRWSDDKRELVSNNFNALNCLSLGVPLASIGGSANCLRPMEIGFSEWSYTGSVEFKPANDIMVYATTRRGYRAGGLQESTGGTTVAVADAAFIPFDPEIVTDYEIGIKSFLFDRTLKLNVNYFHSDIDGAIRQNPRPVPGSTVTATTTQNAAKVAVDGVELDAMLRPIPQIELAATGAWTDARFIRYITPTGLDFSHLPVLATPEWSYGLSAAYIANLDIGKWRTQVDYAWTGRQLIVEPGAYIPSHGILNARSTLDWEDAGIEIAVFVKNLTNERYPSGSIDLSALGMVTSGSFNAPRRFGVELTKAF